MLVKRVVIMLMEVVIMISVIDNAGVDGDGG